MDSLHEIVGVPSRCVRRYYFSAAHHRQLLGMLTTNVRSLSQVLVDSGFHVLDVMEIGVGVLCTCSGSSSTPSPAGTSTSPLAGAISGDAFTAEIEARSVSYYTDR